MHLSFPVHKNNLLIPLFTNSRISLFLNFLIALLLFLLFSCSSSPKPHSSSSYQEEFKDGTVKKDCKFIRVINASQYLHHCKLYHENGNLAEEGDFINDTIATGWHTYYRVSGSRKAMREYLEFPSGSIYLNRVIRFEINGDTNKVNSNYYSIWFDRDTLQKGELLSAHFKLDAPFFEDSYIQVTIEQGDVNEVLASNRTHQSDNTIGVPAVKGTYILKGFIDEIQKIDQQGDTVKVQKRPLYFSKSYWVE